MRMILIVLAAVTCQQYAFATTSQEDAAIQAALDARNQFVSALVNKDFTGLTHEAMDKAIHEFADQLVAEHQDTAMANELLDQWNQTASNFADAIEARLANKDLGDHAPLFPWLNDYIKQLDAKYGGIISTLPIVKDIQTLNFAIPVVFNPRGSWQSPSVDNRIEYRKHFIPFADIVTYYVSEYGCKYALAHYGMSDLKKICPKAAAKLEHVMGRYIAPPVSDWIFKQSNHSIQISSQQLRYNTLEDLRNAIQN